MYSLAFICLYPGISSVFLLAAVNLLSPEDRKLNIMDETLRGYKGVIFLLGEFLVLGLVYVVAYYVEDWLDIYRR